MNTVKSMLDPIEHKRLIMDMPAVLSTANLPERFLFESMTAYCKAQEIDWVRNFHEYRKAKAGIVLVGVSDMETRCMAICGALLRNFIDARFLTLNSIIEDSKKGEVPNPTVLIMSNLYVASYGKSLTSWQIQSIYDVLLSRYTASRPSVLYVQSIIKLEEAFGSVFAEHLKGHYVLVEE